MSRPPWPVGSATGIGSLPGTDALQACTDVLESLPQLPHLPELPARGLGADAVGRSAALLVDLPVETVAAGWQVASRPGADLARATALLREDLGALEVAAHGWTGALKVQVLGPLTLAAALARPRGEAAVADPGLLRDLAGSLAEGVRTHLDEVTTRVPGARLVLQVDEPSLPSVLAGRITTRSGWGQLSQVDEPVARAVLAEVLQALPEPGSRVVHCCARGMPVTTVVAAGAGAVSFDLATVGDSDLDRLAAAVDAGASLVVGAVPTSGTVGVDRVVDQVRSLWTRLGFGADTMRRRTVVSPSCGLAGATAAAARDAYRIAREAAARVAEHA